MATDPGTWTLLPGDGIRRVDLHSRYGGGRQGGIAPSRRSPNVLIFSEAASGEQHGYYDEWDTAGIFHYTGEGQRGDQRLVAGNRMILDHFEQGRALRLFEGARGTVTYLGEFELADDEPYYWMRAPETAGGPLRQVVRFRLRPVANRVQRPDERPAREVGTGYRKADEQSATSERKPFEVDPDKVDRGTRAHAATQNALARAAEAAGAHVLSPDTGDPDFDVAWRLGEQMTVAEVKSLSGTNEAKQLRLGLGQVLDYQDILSSEGDRPRAVLAVEREPTNRRWVQLCDRHGVRLAWPMTFVALFANLPETDAPDE